MSDGELLTQLRSIEGCSPIIDELVSRLVPDSDYLELEQEVVELQDKLSRVPKQCPVCEAQLNLEI